MSPDATCRHVAAQCPDVTQPGTWARDPPPPRDTWYPLPYLHSNKVMQLPVSIFVIAEWGKSTSSPPMRHIVRQPALSTGAQTDALLGRVCLHSSQLGPALTMSYMLYGQDPLAPAIAQCALCAILNTNIALSIIVNCELNKLTNYQLSNILFYNI